MGFITFSEVAKMKNPCLQNSSLLTVLNNLAKDSWNLLVLGKI